VKFTSYILALYLLLLSAVPCCAFDNCADDKIEQQTSHQEGDGDCGSCSPFFTCQGCITATIVPVSLQFEFQVIPVLSVQAIYIQQSLPKIDYDFWQPPKLVIETPSV
jgi:hypothetical protein